MTFELTILGSNSALPTVQRNSTAQVLNVHERFFLIDCGEATQIQLRRFKIRFGKINHIFISHLHGDHYYGLFGLISTFKLLGRTSDLHIHAHAELEAIINFQTKYIGELGYNIFFHPLSHKKSNVIYEDENVFIKNFSLKHRIPTCGFVFTEKKRQRNIIKKFIEQYSLGISDIVSIKNGNDFITTDGQIIKNEILTTSPNEPRSYAFCSDTLYNEKIIKHIEGVDLLYHEATYSHDMLKEAKKTFHSTALQAATIAKLANAKKLVIGHFSARYKDVGVLLNEAKQLFTNTIAAEDGLVVKVDEKRYN